MPILGVFVLPILLRIAVSAVVALPSPLGSKAASSGALVVGVEGVFLIPALILGREAAPSYRRYVGPRSRFAWFGRG